MTACGFMSQQLTPTPLPSSSSSSSPSSTPSSSSSLLSGAITLLNQDLGLIEKSSDGSHPMDVMYFSAGTFTSGKYQGYKRIIALEVWDGPMPVPVDVFATRDNGTYIFDASDAPIGFDSHFNTTKQIKADDNFPSAHASSFILDDNFVLVRDQPIVNYDDKLTLKQDLSQYEIIQVPGVTELKFYTPKTPLGFALNDIQQPENYFAGSTGIIAIDDTGFAYKYYETTTSDPNFKAKNATPALAWSVPPPHFSLASTQGLSDTLYATYDEPFPQACGRGLNALVMTQAFSSDRLKKIGKTQNIDFFTLNDANDELIQFSYNFKIVDPAESDMKAQYRANLNLPKPTLAEYAAKNPLLFFKDFWGRLVMIQESLYPVPGECGKPVVYLYPTREMKVHVQFEAPMDFTTTIPTYHEGWAVNAKPNGELTDLQPQFTDCALIDTDHVGSEYAQAACESKTYPYLYWAGSVLGHAYPTPKQGWVVARADLDGFMNATLDRVGFTAQEKNDMLSYWLPNMLQKQVPFYQVSFIQTKDMNALAPMRITPAPDSVYRLFLDYKPLESQSAVQLSPQQLERVRREGFTVVEWGGLKR